MPTPVEITWLDAKVPPAQTTHRLWGVPASVTLAQCIIESASDKGWGQSDLALKALNFFGMKAVGDEPSITLPTYEYLNGKKVLIQAKFAKYGTVLDSFAAHAHLLASAPRYKSAMALTHDPTLFAGALHACGYSTAPDYGAKLVVLMHQLDLFQYDLPAKAAQQ